MADSAGSLSSMTAGGENQEGKPRTAPEHKQEQFIRKQLSHLPHKRCHRGKRKKSKYFPAKSDLITALTSKTSFNSQRNFKMIVKKIGSSTSSSTSWEVSKVMKMLTNIADDV